MGVCWHLGPGCSLRRTARQALLAHRLSVDRRMSYRMGHRLALHPLQARQGSMDQLDCEETVIGDQSSSIINYFAPMLEFNTGRIALGGHRGMGANVWETTGPATAQRSRKYRENTITSFLAAAQYCTFIEFDCQVTSDGTPIIFHDNFVVFGDESSPTSSLVKHLSVSDFKSLAPINSAGDFESLNGGSDEDATSTAGFPFGGSSSSRGGSPMGGSPLGLSPRGNNRLLRKHRNAEPAVAFEPSLHPWEVSTEDDFPTLSEVFAAVPQEVGFDIEVKMTTPHNILKTPPEEVDRVVTATLKAVDQASIISSSPTALRRPRAVMFSSFDPEVCIELKSRRPEFSVMFLSAGEAQDHVDPRRTSIIAAIDFAAGNGLDGIILDTLVLRQQTNMVAVARQHGLEVMTYGIENNEEEWVMEQERLGVHGAIVDDVERVVQAYSQRKV